MVDRKEIEKKTRKLYTAAKFSSLGLELGISVVIGLFGGWWVDGKLDSQPVGMLIGMGFGLLAGARSITRAVRIASQNEEDG